MNLTEAVIIRVLAGVRGAVPSTKLVKLVYLVDYLHFQHFGRTVTGLQYQWDHFGPNALGHAIISEAEKLAQRDLVKIISQPNIHGGVTISFAQRTGVEGISLSPEAEMVIEDVIHEYGALSVRAITARSKQTAPFKNAAQYRVLSMEQSSPAISAIAGDWDAFQRDLKENGTLSLDEVKRRYKMA
ncbi:MAG: DUF4065 domain-containing protein [SAR202 cluster bacterium]|nr:DUF4065 domain-containing protein [SAR202 cluster bacterium]